MVVAAAAHPATLLMATLQTPDILTGRPPIDGIRVIDGWYAIDTAARLTLPPGAKGLQFDNFVPFKFGLMLAKIAHAYAAAVIGLDKLEPLLPDIVLGRSKALSAFVGGEYAIPAAEPNTLHRLNERRVSLNDRHYAVVDVRLFANLGAPKYQIVVGKFKGR
jgi:hypothetical protein